MPVDPQLIARFNAKWLKDTASDCHLWTGASLPKGYGIIKRPRERRQFYAHRLSYLIHIGEIPDRVEVCHRCDNPGCVNPDHLFLGTSSDNHQDMKAKGRHLYGERNGNSKFTPDEVRQIHAMWKSGVSQRRIARAFDVVQGTISKITRGERWAHIKPKRR